MEKDETFMRLALAEAGRAAAGGEVPVGAVVVFAGDVIAATHNSPITLKDPTAHAEIIAIREACRKVGNYRLTGASLFVTLEPCVMCCGAIVQARLDRVVYGAADPKGGGASSLYSILSDSRLNHQVGVVGGILKEECAEILSRFFREKRITSTAL
ncbi:MAG: tRNA adenosine(34) deaminase TadA [Smithellaceae bacterium]|nr:tRNA adenosine(34) deaminase TadA [Smithellaceae bacterium]